LESIRNFLNRLLPKDSAMRHVSILAGGTTIAQGLNVAIMPVLSRIYSPSDFGVMAVFVSVTAILTELSGFRYHFAIPLPKQVRYAKAILVLSFFLQSVFVVVISLLLVLIGKPLLKMVSMETLIPFRFLIPVAVAGMGAYITLTQWAIREKLFQTIARTKVTQSISGAIAMVSLGFLGFRPFGLLIGKIIGQAGGITTLARSIIKKKGLPKPPLEDIKRAALRYRKFPMYETWSGMLNTVGRQIMPILLVALYDPQVAGLFAMAQSLLHIPTVFVGQAIGQVFLQRASVARYEGNLKELSLKTYTLLLRLGFFPILLISFFAPPVFSFLLGPKWLEAGSFAQILGPWIGFIFASSPIGLLLTIQNRQGTGLIFEGLLLVTRVVSIWLGSLWGGPFLAMTLFVIFSLVILIPKMVYSLKIAGNSVTVIIIQTLLIVVEAVVLLSLPFGAFVVGSNPKILALFVVFSLSLFLVINFMRYTRGSLKKTGGWLFCL